MPAPVADKTGQIQPRNGVAAPKKPDKMAELIVSMTPEIAKALPKHLTADRMARLVLTAMRLNPELAECTPASFLGCVLSCAMLGLEPNTALGLAHLIPRMNRRGNRPHLECTLQLGYQGMISLANNAGVDVTAYAVRAGDTFSYQLGTDPKVIHIPSDDADREKKPITHAYCVALTSDGRRPFRVLSIAQIEERRARSPAANDGPWVTDYEAMCLKTCVRAQFKWMPKSTEKQTILARGVAIEEAAENGTPLLAAFDPSVTDALSRNGIALDAEGEDPASAAENGGTTVPAQDASQPTGT